MINYLHLVGLKRTKKGKKSNQFARNLTDIHNHQVPIQYYLR